jgi:LPS sulfotransferase NodH
MPPTLSYFVCTTPRSGSTLLTDALYKTEIAGRPSEYFDENYGQLWIDRLGIQSDADYLDKVLKEGSTPNGVFGLKVFWFQFELLRGKLARVHGRESVDDALVDQWAHNLKYIFLVRNDKVRQAVSYLKASQTEMWWCIPGDPDNPTKPKEEPRFDFEEIDRRVAFLTEQEDRWRAYFQERGIKPIQLEYDQVAQSYDETIRFVLSELGIPYPSDQPIPTPRLVKQSSKENEIWIRQYHELKSRQNDQGHANVIGA